MSFNLTRIKTLALLYYQKRRKLKLIAEENDIMRNATEISRLTQQLHHGERRLFPEVEESSELSVACYRADFSASRIARAVEDSEAHLLNLNVTSEALPSGEIVIDLRVSHRNAAAVVRSLERYGFEVVAVRGGGPSDSDDTLTERVGELLAHLNV